MAVIDQKLSKVAHPLYADANDDATNNCIRNYFCVSRIKEEWPAELSSGDEALAGDPIPFSPLISDEAGFIGDECCFRYCSPANRSLAGGTAPNS